MGPCPAKIDDAVQLIENEKIFNLKTMLTVAVIIAARSAGAWLEQCLESVARQQLPPGWQLRVSVGIDECAETLAVAQTLDTGRFQFRYFPARIGPYVIFNSLANAGHFDAMARFDADDIMLDGYLMAQLRLLGSGELAAITHTWSIYVDAHLRPTAAPLASGSSTPRDGRRAEASHGQFLLTRPAWLRLGGFQPWWCHADTEFLSRAAWSGVARHTVREYLYLRRVHGGSLTRSGDAGYGSKLRQYYASQIARGQRRYAYGSLPECLRPVASGSYAVVSLTRKRHAGHAFSTPLA
jgi:hypothetical protein